MSSIVQRFTSLRKSNAYSILYTLLLVTWLILAVAGDTQVAHKIPHHGIRMIETALVALLYFIFCWKPDPKSLIYEIGVFIVATSAFLFEYDAILMTVVFAYCARPLPLNRLLRISLVTLSTSVALVIIACLAGIIPDVLVTRVDASGTVVYRHSLGFFYTTFLSHYYLFIVTAYAYLRHFELRIPELLVMAALDVAIYVLTDSRNSFIHVAILLVAIPLVQLLKRHGHSLDRIVPRFILRWSFVIMAVLSALLLLAAPANSSLGQTLDKALSSRVHLTQEAFARYGITPFGQQINWSITQDVEGRGKLTGYYPPGKNTEFVEAPYSYVDCSYLNLLITQGVVPFALVMFALTWWTRWCVKKRRWDLAAILLVFALHSVLDPQMLYLNYCPFLLGMTMPLSSVLQHQHFRAHTAKVLRGRI